MDLIVPAAVVLRARVVVIDGLWGRDAGDAGAVNRAVSIRAITSQPVVAAGATAATNICHHVGRGVAQVVGARIVVILRAVKHVRPVATVVPVAEKEARAQVRIVIGNAWG